MITVVFGAQLAQLASTKQELWPELNELLDASVQECAVESTCLKRWLFASCSLSRCASSSKPKLQESVALVGDSGLKNAWEELMMLLRQQVGGRAQQANHISMRRTSKRAHRCYSKTVGGVKLK
eukprot:g23875.t1